MSFFDKARAGYENLAGRADQALDSATASKDLGDIDQHYRDLGVLAYLAATGRPADPAAEQHLMAVLSAMEQRGAIRDFVLASTGRAPAGVPAAPPRHGGSDGIPQPPPERAGRHGDFLTQQVAPPPPQPPPSEPAEGPAIGGTWGPPSQDSTGPARWRPVGSGDE